MMRTGATIASSAARSTVRSSLIASCAGLAAMAADMKATKAGAPTFTATMTVDGQVLGEVVATSGGRLLGLGPDVNPPFEMDNRSKRSIVLDLRTIFPDQTDALVEAARTVFDRL